MDLTITMALMLFQLVIFVFIIFAVAGCYKKCGPNEAMVISGGGIPHPKVVVGGGAFVIPQFQRLDYLSLEVMPVEIKMTKPVTTKDGIPFYVDAVAQIKIQGDDASIRTAAEQFLGKDASDITNATVKVLAGHLNAVIGSVEALWIIRNFDEFTSKVVEQALGDMQRLGLAVVSLTVKEVRDEVGFLEQLGKDRTLQAKTESDLLVKEVEANRTRIETALYAEVVDQILEIEKDPLKMTVFTSLDPTDKDRELAEKIHKTVLDMLREAYGDNSLFVALWKIKLARLYAEDKPENAQGLYRDGLKVFEQKFGKDHSVVAKINKEIPLKQLDA